MMSATDLALENIDWSTLAFPHEQGDDNAILLQLGKAHYEALPIQLRSDLYHYQTPYGEIQFGHIAQQDMTAPTFLAAPLQHDAIAQALQYLHSWPQMLAQVAALVKVIHPCWAVAVQSSHPTINAGSYSHGPQHLFGAFVASIDDPIGLAQAIVHETAHLKLRCIGIEFNSAQRLIVNGEQQYLSPIKMGVKRPMSAVFHAQYSFMHVLAFDVKFLQQVQSPLARDHLMQLMVRNLIRMKSGLNTVEQNIQTDAQGKLFVDGFVAQSKNIIIAAEQALEHSEYALTNTT